MPSSASSDSQQPSPCPATTATRTDQILACRADKPPKWCLSSGPVPDPGRTGAQTLAPQPTPVVGAVVVGAVVVGAADGAWWFQPCMAGRRVKSRMLTAVAVPPLTVAVTTT